MKPLRIFRHAPAEGPGYLAEVLERRGIPYQLVAVDRGEAVPDAVDGVAGLVFMGGPMSVNDPLPWINDELRLIRRAAQQRLPILGHCLGGQLISKALGGKVGPNPVKEIGWYPVERIDNAAATDWLNGLPDRFEVFHWHGETFTLPPGAVPLLKSAYCTHQGFALDNVLALQCHVEMTADMVAEWAQLSADEIAKPCASVQSAEQMTRDLAARVGALQKMADSLYARWLRPVLAGQTLVRSPPVS
ncbi:MAG: type 1 glutamine amidotransferase [Gammaproteobacteria bacterium]|nr:type 1 glutamine amidotransferase [Gammaproteobacteria bacterium]